MSPHEPLPPNLARWVRRAGGRERVKVRELRDWGRHQRLTAAAREELIAQLSTARIQIDEDLRTADLDDVVTLHARLRAKRFAVLVGLLSTLGLAAGLVVDGPQAFHSLRCWINGPCVTAQGGDINVAVARISAGPRSADSAAARRLGLSLARALSRAAAPDGLQLDVRGPDTVGVLPPSHRAQEKLMDRLDAHFLLTGVETFNTRVTRLRLQVIGNPDRLPGAEELSYSVATLAVRGDARTSATAEVQLRGLVLQRVRTLTDLLGGLGYMGQRRYSLAAAALGRAASAWPTMAGKELPELLLANALMRKRRWGAARLAYEKALRIHPGYARARFGLASLAFRAARGSCTRATIDRTAIAMLQRRFSDIARTSNEPLRSKSLFERASADVCLAQAGVGNGFRRAHADLESVLIAWQTNAVTLQEEAAESYGLLGFIARPGRGAEPTRAQLLRAAQYYHRAAAVAPDETRRRFFFTEEARLRRAAGGP